MHIALVYVAHVRVVIRTHCTLPITHMQLADPAMRIGKRGKVSLLSFNKPEDFDYLLVRRRDVAERAKKGKKGKKKEVNKRGNKKWENKK